MSGEEGLERMLTRLNQASETDDADRSVDWPAELEPDGWHLTPELISLYGTPWYEALDEAARRRLSFHEAVNFFSLNVHGEKSLVAGLSQRLYRKAAAGDAGPIPGYDAYLHHFLGEENLHMSWFGGFCSRYAGGIYPDRKMAFPSGDAAKGEEEFLFFAKVLLFEEIVDVYNVRCARDERLHPLVRRINGLHHRDETRHLAFGRRVVGDLFACHAEGWDSATLERVRTYLAGYLESMWKEYFNPTAYADAGLPGDALALRRQAFDHPAARERRARIERPCLDFLRRHGILEKETLA